MKLSATIDRAAAWRRGARSLFSWTELPARRVPGGPLDALAADGKRVGGDFTRAYWQVIARADASIGYDPALREQLDAALRTARLRYERGTAETLERMRAWHEEAFGEDGLYDEAREVPEDMQTDG